MKVNYYIKNSFSALFQTPLVPTLASFPNAAVTAAAAVIRASGGGGMAAIPTVTVAPSILAAVSLPTSVFTTHAASERALALT